MKNESYYEGKILFKNSEDNSECTLYINNINFQTINDIKNRVKEILEEDSKIYNEFDRIEFYVRERYILRDKKTDWERVEL